MNDNPVQSGEQAAVLNAPIRLVTVKATCPDCGVVKSQIDTSREHAIEVVTTAMTRHMEEAHR